jgi:hypothetical protein
VEYLWFLTAIIPIALGITYFVMKSPKKKEKIQWVIYFPIEATKGQILTIGSGVSNGPAPSKGCKVKVVKVLGNNRYKVKKIF